jgi:hypothetical protein
MNDVPPVADFIGDRSISEQIEVINFRMLYNTFLESVLRNGADTTTRTVFKNILGTKMRQRSNLIQLIRMSEWFPFHLMGFIS